MPTLPLPSSTTLGTDLPVTDEADVLAEFAAPQKNPDTAIVRDSIASAYAEGFIEYQNLAERAAGQSDPMRATGLYLRDYAAEREVVPAPGESEVSIRARLFQAPRIVTPDAIKAIIDEVIAPRTCHVSELDLDGWFLHASSTTSVWESFVGAEPNYPDRYYTDIPGSYPGGAVPTNNLPRSFHVRIPALQAQDLDFAFIGDAFFVMGDATNTADNIAIFQNQQTSVDLYNAIISRVQAAKGQGISWSMIIDPTL